MAGPTRSKAYHGEPAQQHAAYEADRAEAARYGWQPIDLEQLPGSLVVTYAQPEVSEGQAPARSRRTQEPGIWKWLSIGVSVAVIVLAVWAQSVGKPPSVAPSDAPAGSSSPNGDRP